MGLWSLAVAVAVVVVVVADAVHATAVVNSVAGCSVLDELGEGMMGAGSRSCYSHVVIVVVVAHVVALRSDSSGGKTALVFAGLTWTVDHAIMRRHLSALHSWDGN